MPTLPTRQLLLLANLSRKLADEKRTRELNAWLTPRLALEARSGGKLDPLGGRIYVLIVVMELLAEAGVDPFTAHRLAGYPTSSRTVYAGPAVLCEATGRGATECTIATKDLKRPYRLSHAAADRLEHRCLAPVEWYRLVIRHGRQEFYLCDEFYDANGKARRPLLPVVRTRGDSLPSAQSARENLGRLINFALYQCEVGRPMETTPELAAMINSFGAPAVESKLTTLAAKLPTDRIEHFCWQTRVGLGYVDDKAIRQRWARIAADPVRLLRDCPALARDSIPIVGMVRTLEVVVQATEQHPQKVAPTDRPLCWPPRQIIAALDGAIDSEILLELAIELIEAMPAEDIAPTALHCLPRFSGPRVLDWIEARAVEPVGYQWGAIAAVCGIDWDRVRRWLGRGKAAELRRARRAEKLPRVRPDRPGDVGPVPEELAQDRRPPHPRRGR